MLQGTVQEKSDVLYNIVKCWIMGLYKLYNFIKGYGGSYIQGAFIKELLGVLQVT